MGFKAQYVEVARSEQLIPPFIISRVMSLVVELNDENGQTVSCDDPIDTAI